jgi:hypothetical protein
MENFDVQPDPREVGSTKIEKEEAAIRLTRSGGVQCLATAHPTATGRDFDKLGSGPEFGDRQFNDCVRTEPKGGRGSKRNQSRMGQTDEFQLLTSFVLPAKVLQSSKSDVKSLGLPTLDLHLARLLIGHHAIAQAIPESWCANEPPIAPEMIVQALDSTIQSHREQSSASHSLRVRLTIGPSQTVSLVTSPMPPIPQIKLLVSIDDHPTTYEGDPFLLTKTTYRSHYDHTRLRHGLWNHSSFLVIDYIEEKTTHERTLAE